MRRVEQADMQRFGNEEFPQLLSSFERYTVHVPLYPSGAKGYSGTCTVYPQDVVIQLFQGRAHARPLLTYGCNVAARSSLLEAEGAFLGMREEAEGSGAVNQCVIHRYVAEQMELLVVARG
jgi:hypothetical protein